MSEELLTPYRPVVHAEFDLIRDSGFHRFPPRLVEQTIFYPVLDRCYAEPTARDWNAPDPACGHAGYVLQFQVPAVYASRFPVQSVGDRTAKELWVPAGELEAFNEQIVGRIKLVAEFRGAAADRKRAVEAQPSI